MKKKEGGLVASVGRKEGRKAGRWAGRRVGGWTHQLQFAFSEKDCAAFAKAGL